METPITCLLILDKVGRIHQPRISNHRLRSKKVEWSTVSRYFLERITNLFFFFSLYPCFRIDCFKIFCCGGIQTFSFFFLFFFFFNYISSRKRKKEGQELLPIAQSILHILQNTGCQEPSRGGGREAHPLHPPLRSAPAEKNLSREGALGAHIDELPYYWRM